LLDFFRDAFKITSVGNSDRSSTGLDRAQRGVADNQKQTTLVFFALLTALRLNGFGCRTGVASRSAAAA